MKHFFLIAILIICTNAFSQSKTDSIIYMPSVKSIVIQKVDSSQIERINEVEERLSAFYTYNRRSHSLIYAGMALSVIGAIVSSNDSGSGAIVLPLAGGVVSLIGTVIYLDSYKFLNFKPKRKVMNSMTYY
jgi:hypothetical protein